MNRRKFIRNAAIFSAPLFLKNVPVFAGGGLSHPLLEALARTANYCDKVLVIVQLNGGNDGLNMILPLDKYAELSAARPGLIIPQNQSLRITDPGNSSVNNATALHPSLTGLADLYNNGKLTIVQGVSYPNPSFSHFQAQDIWFSGSTTPGASQNTGWLGRDLSLANPGYPNGYPNATNPDPLAIQIGGSLPLCLQGPNINTGYNAPDPAALLNVVNATPAPAPISDYGTELTFLRLMKDQSNAYTSRITTAYNAQPTLSNKYASTGNSLSDQLRIVARLIGGGLQTPVYIVNHQKSFDTHANQVDVGSPTTGNHANMLSDMSVGISAFVDDVALMGKGNRVTGMTFSEFGRRVVSNASNGTDHGAGAPVLFFGAALLGGILGTSPNLPPTSTTSTQVDMQYDYRQLYASIMENWLCMSSADADNVLGSHYTRVPLFNSTALGINDIELNGGWMGNRAQLTFVVNGNEEFDFFEVERALSLSSFSTQATISNNNGAAVETYNYDEERSEAAQVTYRIKGVQRNGKTRYSATLLLSNGNTSQWLRVYPNPVHNFTFIIEFLEKVSTAVEIKISDTRGAILFRDQRIPINSQIRMTVNDYFEPHTLYFLHIRTDQREQTEKIQFAS